MKRNTFKALVLISFVILFKVVACTPDGTYTLKASIVATDQAFIDYMQDIVLQYDILTPAFAAMEPELFDSLTTAFSNALNNGFDSVAMYAIAGHIQQYASHNVMNQAIWIRDQTVMLFENIPGLQYATEEEIVSIMEIAQTLGTVNPDFPWSYKDPMHMMKGITGDAYSLCRDSCANIHRKEKAKSIGKFAFTMFCSAASTVGTGGLGAVLGAAGFIGGMTQLASDGEDNESAYTNCKNECYDEHIGGIPY